MDHRDLATAHGKRRAGDRFDTQEIEGDTRTRDVEDRIDRADFVEVYLLDRRAVHACFGLRQAFVDAPRSRFLMRSQIARIEDGEHVVEMTPVFRRAIAFAIDYEVDVRRRDVPPRGALAFERPETNRNRAQRRLEGGPIDAGIEQCAQDHIAARATDRLEIRDSHAEARVARAAEYTSRSDAGKLIFGSQPVAARSLALSP